MSTAQSDARIIRIGGASGFWGDSVCGPIQLVERAEIDYLVFDYLAETTMAILAAPRLKNPDAGYATDFVDTAMRSVVKEVVHRRIKVLANAGGINPESCCGGGVGLRTGVVLTGAPSNASSSSRRA